MKKLVVLSLFCFTAWSQVRPKNIVPGIDAPPLNSVIPWFLNGYVPGNNNSPLSTSLFFNTAYFKLTNTFDSLGHPIPRVDLVPQGYWSWRGPYNSNLSYSLGDYVEGADGRLYRALVGSQGQPPPAGLCGGSPCWIGVGGGSSTSMSLVPVLGEVPTQDMTNKQLFTLGAVPVNNQVAVYLNGLKLPATGYTVSGTTLTILNPQSCGYCTLDLSDAVSVDYFK